MLATALRHFLEDIDRARSLVTHAQGQPAGTLKDDVLRAGWMMAVGACDAYFSDAYADLISRALRAKDLQPAVAIPDRLNNLKVPVTAILTPAAGGWRWRMAARELIETENVLSLEKIKSLFNHFFRNKHKLLTTETIESWMLHPSSKQRLFGISATAYRKLTGSVKEQAKKDALGQLHERFEAIFQRRHDCIHNCDRPKVALQPVSADAVSKTIEDIDFLVQRSHSALLVEFPVYLANLGFSGATRSQVCA